MSTPQEIAQWVIEERNGIKLGVSTQRITDTEMFNLLVGKIEDLLRENNLKQSLQIGSILIAKKDTFEIYKGGEYTVDTLSREHGLGVTTKHHQCFWFDFKNPNHPFYYLKYFDIKL